MEIIYSTDQNKKLLLYHFNNQILLRTISGDLFGRPSILANDFLKDLSSAIYNGTIYYSYINNEQCIVIKSVSEPNTLYRLANSGSFELYVPQILVFNKQLLLFYTIKNPLENSYSVKCILPFQQDVAVTIPDSFPLIPKLNVISTANNLFISLSSDFVEKILLLDSKYHCSTLGTKANFVEDQNQAHLSELQQLYKIIEDKNDIIKKQTLTLHEKEKNLRNLHAQIESAKKQYNHLMDVANQYREEAIKWRSKLTTE